MFDHILHIILTDELPRHFKARTVLECSHQIMRTHYFIVLIQMTTFWNVSAQVFNDNWVRWTNIKTVHFCAFSQKQGNSIFITDFETRFHYDALSVPESIQVRLTEPLVTTLNVILMVCLELYALIMLDIYGQLLKVDHGVTKQPVL